MKTIILLKLDFVKFHKFWPIIDDMDIIEMWFQ